MQGSHQDAAAIRARLLEQRAALVEGGKDAAGSRAPVQLDQTSVGRLSRMDAMQMQAMALDPAIPTCLERAAGPGR